MFQLLLFTGSIIACIVGGLVVLIGIGAIAGCVGGLIVMLAGGLISLLGAGAAITFLFPLQDNISTGNPVINLIKQNGRWS